MRWRILLPVSGFLAAAAAVLGLGIADHMARALDASLPAQADISPAPGDVAIGSADAPVTVLALVSLTCVHCRLWEEQEMPLLVSGPVAGGTVRLVIRAFPLDRAALDGAALVSCLPDGERAAAQALLMSAQATWPGRGAATVAAAAGLSGDRARDATACAGSPGRQAAIAGVAQAAHDQWGIAGTPSFVVGRRVVTGALSAARIAALAADAAAGR